MTNSADRPRTARRAAAAGRPAHHDRPHRRHDVPRLRAAGVLGAFRASGVGVGPGQRAPRGKHSSRGSGCPSRGAVDAAIREAGYRPQAPSWFVRDRAAWLTVAGAAVVAALVVALAGQLGLGGLAGSANGGGVALALLVGLAAGFSTCMALVGGLVMALTASYGLRHPDRVATWQGRVRPQVAFNGGRILGFAAGGAVLGMLGSAFEIPTTVLAVGVLAAAVVMTILGIRLTGLSPRIAAWSPTLPGRWGRRAADGGAGAYTDWRAASAGAATFVLPCGFTQAMQIYAVSTGSPRRPPR